VRVPARARNREAKEWEGQERGHGGGAARGQWGQRNHDQRWGSSSTASLWSVNISYGPKIDYKAIINNLQQQQ
jgi:hypothetical protein